MAASEPVIPISCPANVRLLLLRYPEKLRQAHQCLTGADSRRGWMDTGYEGRHCHRAPGPDTHSQETDPVTRETRTFHKITDTIHTAGAVGTRESGMPRKNSQFSYKRGVDNAGREETAATSLTYKFVIITDVSTQGKENHAEGMERARGGP
ncbi:hypothetical protein VTK73DRAFT_6593 [Phialemonium thermophilum]|uniref:Uncharacterized protein n=1 Tax=Phialemonium thermophilum TaxID=223376 RepID=A0ABR3WJ18_9PEZI